MEGIFGVLRLGNEGGRRVLQLMARALESSPEAAFVVDGQLSIGVKRLPCVSRSQATEPKWTENNRFLCAINGEILNYDELKLALERKGHLVSNDAELVAYLYEQKGEDFLCELDGVFAIAIWDRQRQKLILAQDRYGGIRQIYYCPLPRDFLFASAIRPMLATGMTEREVDDDALFSFFATGHILPPYTMFRTLKKLMPGSVLTWQNGSVAIQRVDAFDFSPPRRRDEWRLEDSFARAVSKRLVSDRPVGLFLSGGIDSSLTVATAARFAESPLKTLSLGFTGSSLDESSYAQLVAHHFRTDHQQLYLESGNALDPLPTIVWHLEEPLAHVSVVPTYWLVNSAKAQVDVVLASDGPDHLFGRHYYAPKWRSLCRFLPGSRFLRSYLLQGRSWSRSRVVRKAQRVAYACDVPLDEVWMMEYSLEGAMSLLSIGSRAPCGCRSQNAEPLCPQVADEYAKLIVCDFIGDGSFGAFAKMGKMAAGESLVIREPYFNREVVDYINGLPQEVKRRGSALQYLTGRAESKYYLRHALAKRVLPHEVLLKRKRGFRPPMGDWLREKLQGLTIEDLLSPSVRESGYFNLSSAERVLHQHLSGTREHTRALFMLLVFDLWHRLYIDSLAIARPTTRLIDHYQ